MLGTEPSIQFPPGRQQEQLERQQPPAVQRSFSGLTSQLRLSDVLAPWRTGFVLGCVDQVMLVCGLSLAAVLVWLVGVPISIADTLPLAGAVGAASCFSFWAAGLYPGIGINPVQETRQIVVAWNVVAVALAVAVALSESSTPGVLLMIGVWATSVGLLPLGRMTARAICSRFQWWRHPIVILGDSQSAQRVAARLRRWRTLGLEPIGHIHHFHHQWEQAPTVELSYMGPPEEAADLIRQRGIQWAMLALPAGSGSEQADVLAAATLFRNVLIVDEDCLLPSLWSRTIDIDGCSGRYLQIPSCAASSHFKRAFDIVVAGVLTIFAAPVCLLIALLIRLISAGPALYAQERIGHGGCPFRAWKFRTMVPNADQVLSDYLNLHPELREEWDRSHKLKDDPRIIPGIGRILRNYSLDELPQLWNVLSGEMSLVGPRPIVHEEISKYHDDFAVYTQVLPGITGLWQISGRNNTTYQRRVYLDCYYIRNWSPWLDFYILLRTIKTVLLREGAY